MATEQKDNSDANTDGQHGVNWTETLLFSLAYSLSS